MIYEQAKFGAIELLPNQCNVQNIKKILILLFLIQYILKRNRPKSTTKCSKRPKMDDKNYQKAIRKLSSLDKKGQKLAKFRRDFTFLFVVLCIDFPNLIINWFWLVAIFLVVHWQSAFEGNIAIFALITFWLDYFFAVSDQPCKKSTFCKINKSYSRQLPNCNWSCEFDVKNAFFQKR